MEYFVIFLPFILLLSPRRILRKRRRSYKDVIELIEGREETEPRRVSELYKVAKLLLEVRKLYGAKALESLAILKKEAFKADREHRKIRSVLYGAYFQQLIMALLILAMIFITNSMFESSSSTYFIILLLQVIAILMLHSSNFLLSKIFINGGVVRLRNLLIIRTLSQSGLSVSRVLKNVDWNSMKDTSSKRLSQWDQRFLISLSQWQESGSGLFESIEELDEELQFLRTFGEKKFQDYMNGAKFMALLVGGFLSYFVYLFSFVGKLLT